MVTVASELLLGLENLREKVCPCAGLQGEWRLACEKKTCKGS